MKQFTLTFNFEDNDYTAEVTETIKPSEINILVSQHDLLLTERFGKQQKVVMKEDGKLIPAYDSQFMQSIITALYLNRNEYPRL